MDKELNKELLLVLDEIRDNTIKKVIQYKDGTDIPSYLNELEQIEKIKRSFSIYEEEPVKSTTDYLDNNGVRLLPIGALVKKTYQFETRNVAKLFVYLFQSMLSDVKIKPSFTNHAIHYDMCINEEVICKATFNNNLATDHGNAQVTVVINDEEIVKEVGISYHDEQIIIDLIDLIIETNKEKLKIEVEEN